MTLPLALSANVEGTLGVSVANATPVGGGCINNGSRLETSDGQLYFLKWNRDAPYGMFEAEVEGLGAMRGTAGIRIPEPVAHGTDDEGTAWLVMEYIATGPAGEAYQERLGEGLAHVHGLQAGASFGWSIDNWIGSLEQVNTPDPSWADFWADRRIQPQLELARSKGFLTHSLLDALVDVIPAALEDITRGGLLHGDLWGGNVYADEEGGPVLVDPAVYRGHGEVDLAMTELFGGFGKGFYEAYESVTPVSAEYSAYRRDLYQLYYLLVHVNLFGASYQQASYDAARRVVVALT